MVDSRRVTVARARPLASRSRANPSMSARRRRIGAEIGVAPAGELAQVQCVGLAGQPAVPGQVAGEGEPFGSVKAGWMVAMAVDGTAVVIGYSGLAETRELGRRRVPAIERNPT